MKLRLGELKDLLNEEYLRGIPEYALRQETEKYIEGIKRLLFKFILANKSKTPSEQREAMAAANVILEELETEANDLLEEQLWAFIRQI